MGTGEEELFFALELLGNIGLKPKSFHDDRLCPVMIADTAFFIMQEGATYV
ncbi:MAG: hypothetical protein ACP5MI_04705 [Candidatus Kryptoniota bacterium]